MDRAAAFEGDRAATERFLKGSAGRFYVYTLCRPDGRPFYVGKGINRRVFEHEAEARRNHPIGEANPFKCNVIRKLVREGRAITYRIDSLYDVGDQAECLKREAALIALHKRLHEGGILTNLAGGVGNLSGASPFSVERHAATLSGKPDGNPERATLNRFVQSIGPVSSAYIKPMSQIARVLPSTPHPSPRAPSLRCAYALIASATAAGEQIRANVTLPRSFVHQGVQAVIENGVSRDILKAGMADLVPNAEPRLERFRLDKSQVDLIGRLYGEEQLSRRGLI